MIAKKSWKSSTIFGVKAIFRFESRVMGGKLFPPTIGKKPQLSGSSATDVGSKYEIQHCVDRIVGGAVRQAL